MWCLARPQITGFFIQSPCIRGNIIYQLQHRILQHTLWGNALGLSMEKNCSPIKDFYLLFLPSSLFLSANFAACYRMLWVGYSHFSPALCQNLQEIKPTSIPCLRKRCVQIHNISWAHSHIIKVIFHLPAFYQIMNHFYTDPPRLLCSGQGAFKLGGHQVQ